MAPDLSLWAKPADKQKSREGAGRGSRAERAFVASIAVERLCKADLLAGGVLKVQQDAVLD